ncbi:hypothetical protein B0H14DRAFT_3910266 [Mycena olivaceomarginata]|nr:hypothetical protein B0H14DRAFT_3910266 [Mycena olivaceomarginata]
MLYLPHRLAPGLSERLRKPCSSTLAVAGYLDTADAGLGSWDLRPAPYLTETAARFGSGLKRFSSTAASVASWRMRGMMTMPSLLGFEGINPLTVFDHQWTIPRAFHVSPFNDRRGFYTISINNPTHLRLVFVIQKLPGPLKLSALLRSTSATPLTLPLSHPHPLSRPIRPLSVKRLDVFIRPEPVPATWTAPNSNSNSLLPVEGGVRWLDEGPIEAYARRQVEAFLRRRVDETGVPVSLVPGNPSSPPAPSPQALPRTRTPTQTQG